MSHPRTLTLAVLLCFTLTPFAAAQNALSILNDEFDDASTLTAWNRLYQTEGWGPAGNSLQTADINTTSPGSLLIDPHSNAWFEELRGPLIYKEVSGNFALTTSVTIRNGAGLDTLPTTDFSLGGLMFRRARPEMTNGDATWTPGSMNPADAPNGENYTFLSLGRAADGMTPEAGSTWQTEVKTTRNSQSILEVDDQPGNNARIQLATISNTLSTYVLALIEFDGTWTIHRRYERADFAGETLQAGFVAYTDWPKIITYYNNGVEAGAPSDGIRFHNANYLAASNPNPADPNPFVPYTPDIQASFDYARFAALDLPVELMNVDLTDPIAAPNGALLAFLGDNANIPADLSNEIPEPSTAALLALTSLVLLRRRRIHST